LYKQVLKADNQQVL